MPLPGVSVCFPAYNEAATIAGVIEEAHALVEGAGLDYEIVICNDGSKDETGKIVDALARRLTRVRVFHHPNNLGIRDTFEHLYHEAAKEFVFLNSTDRQWDTRILLDMLPLTREWDVIVASRRRKQYSLTRACVSWGFNVVPRLLFGVRVHDAGAVKLVRREIIERFRLVSRSPFNEAERLIRAERAGYRILDRPVDTVQRRTGQARGVHPRLVVGALADVGRVWWALRTEPRPTGRVPDHPAESSHANRS